MATIQDKKIAYFAKKCSLTWRNWKMFVLKYMFMAMEKPIIQL